MLVAKPAFRRRQACHHARGGQKKWHAFFCQAKSWRKLSPRTCGKNITTKRVFLLNHNLKMAKFSILHSFEPTESLEHNHTPKKAAVLGTINYLKDHHI